MNERIYEMNHILNCGYEKIEFITARIIALLDFISAVQYRIHFIYHSVHLQLFKVALNAHQIISCFL